MRAIETNLKLGKGIFQLPWLKQNQVEIIIRHISRGSQDKCIDTHELKALLSNQYTVGIVYELNGGAEGYGLPGNIDAVHGKKDGDYAFTTLKGLGVPKGTVVYFAIDTDITTNSDINTYVIPYLTAAKQSLQGYYRMGVYGCGSTCAAGLDAAGCDKAWLANATGWKGYDTFLTSGRAAIHQGIGNDDYDPNEIKDEDWGGFRNSTEAGV
jgi:hypothetical protein